MIGSCSGRIVPKETWMSYVRASNYVVEMNRRALCCVPRQADAESPGSKDLAG